MRAEKYGVKRLKFKKITSHKNHTYPSLPFYCVISSHTVIEKQDLESDTRVFSLCQKTD